MNLKIIKCTYEELGPGSKMLLAAYGNPFFFVLSRDGLCVNKDMRGINKVLEVAATIWEYNLVENDQIAQAFDSGFDIVRQAAGSLAADQLFKAWREAAESHRKARAVAQAREWISTVVEPMTDEELEEMSAADYDSDFVDHGLWNAYYELHDKNPKSQRYKNYTKNAIRAAVIYGYHLAKKSQAVGV